MPKVPRNVFEGGLRRFAERLATPEMVAKISLAYGMLMSVAVIALAIAIAVMLPLKEKVPYFVETRPGGEVVASNRVAVQFTPDERQMAYFLWTRFAVPLFTIDEQTRQNITNLSHILRGAATQQLVDYLQSTRLMARLVEEPTWRQEVTPAANVEFFKTSNVSGTAVLWLNVKSRGGREPAERKVRLSVDYVRLPGSDDAEVFRNPLGLYVTSFRIDNVYAQ